jgi:hypothetical protein
MGKGAFQLSLSFIIVVVFAVIVLALAISWIQGIFPGITELTHKVTDVARDELLGKIAEGDKRVGIAAPKITSWARGDTGSYAIGIRNIYPDMDKMFYINVYIDEMQSLGDADPSLAQRNTVRTWLTFSDKEFVPKSSSITSDIIIKPPATTNSDIYKFRVMVCEAQGCRTLDDTPQNIVYGTAQFALEIK